MSAPQQILKVLQSAFKLKFSTSCVFVWIFLTLLYLAQWNGNSDFLKKHHSKTSRMYKMQAGENFEKRSFQKVRHCSSIGQEEKVWELSNTSLKTPSNKTVLLLVLSISLILTFYDFISGSITFVSIRHLPPSHTIFKPFFFVVVQNYVNLT